MGRSCPAVGREDGQCYILKLQLKNGTSEFLLVRLQVASLKCSLCNFVLTTVCCSEVNKEPGKARAAL